ncbi:hypothetical protein CAS74_002680 [Pichia kudriavzevii]|uniref:Uncharacterized protein n=1 Tax=Pichia kudriavzevii TaxID=4909 RepID=A0A1Z8JM89_PICKU|nr:hypothetical protein CAS74_002680 [Pichia kudriavzevii]
MSNPLMQAKMFADDLLSEYNPSKLSIVESFFIKFLLAAAIVMVAFAYFDSTSSLNKTGVSAGQGRSRGRVATETQHQPRRRALRLRLVSKEAQDIVGKCEA